MNHPRLGVAEIAFAVSTREAKAVDIVADYLRRADSSQTSLNAFTLIERDAALDAAAETDRRVTAGRPVGPLAGVPIAIKDLIDHAGRPNTAGSSFPAPIPDVSASVVSRLESAGAIVLGRTGLHEYAFGFSSENHWFGPVRNPWNRALSPGGSSGGSASAVAAGAAAAALGTDTGGSVRVPAALCGVVGLKVTHGRVPLSGVFPLASSLDTVGPLARNVSDAALVYEAIAGYDPTDPWSAPKEVIPPVAPADLADVSIGVPHPWVDLPQTDAVASSFAIVLDQLGSAGVSTVHLDVPDLVPSPEINNSLYPEVALVHDRRWHEHRETYGPDVSRRLRDVFAVEPASYVRAQQWRARIRHAAEAAFMECDFLVTPTVAAAQKTIGEEMVDVSGESLPYRPLLSRFSSLVNHTSLPAIALPLDLDGTPPPSVQFIGPSWHEHRLLELGSAIEAIGLSRFRTPPASVH